MKLKIFTDGASRGNPGKAASSYLILGGDRELARLGKKIGIATNNEAEYEAVILALKKAWELKGDEIEIISDSQLVVRQLRGDYKVKSQGLKGLFSKAKRLEKDFSKVSYREVPRDTPGIMIVDRLCNQALDS